MSHENVRHVGRAVEVQRFNQLGGRATKLIFEPIVSLGDIHDVAYSL